MRVALLFALIVPGAALGAAWPIPESVFSGTPRNDFATYDLVQSDRYHTGVDLRARSGTTFGDNPCAGNPAPYTTPVYAGVDGVVARVVDVGGCSASGACPGTGCRDHGLGNTVFVRRTDGLYQQYSHLDSIAADLGARCTAPPASFGRPCTAASHCHSSPAAADGFCAPPKATTPTTFLGCMGNSGGGVARRTGCGTSDFGAHLHFEVKIEPVLGAPARVDLDAAGNDVFDSRATVDASRCGTNCPCYGYCEAEPSSVGFRDPVDAIAGPFAPLATPIAIRVLEPGLGIRAAPDKTLDELPNPLGVPGDAILVATAERGDWYRVELVSTHGLPLEGWIAKRDASCTAFKDGACVCRDGQKVRRVAGQTSEPCFPTPPATVTVRHDDTIAASQPADPDANRIARLWRGQRFAKRGLGSGAACAASMVGLESCASGSEPCQPSVWACGEHLADDPTSSKVTVSPDRELFQLKATFKLLFDEFDPLADVLRILVPDATAPLELLLDPGMLVSKNGAKFSFSGGWPGHPDASTLLTLTRSKGTNFKLALTGRGVDVASFNGLADVLLQAGSAVIDVSANSKLKCRSAIVAYPDADGDGHGDPFGRRLVCTVPPGFVRVGGDCDDASPSVQPGTVAACYDGAEGTQDVGTCAAGVRTCAPDGWSACVGQVLPTAEHCTDGRDDDCDGQADEECCGDQTCDVGESCATCPVDCGDCSGGLCDGFNRPDSPVVGEGWTEIDGSTTLRSSIESGSLTMTQIGHVEGALNGENTRIVRPATLGHAGISLTGRIRFVGDPIGGEQRAARVVVRSGGAAGSGGCPQACGATRMLCSALTAQVYGCPSPNCWRGDGFGFAMFVDDVDQPGHLQFLHIVDAGAELASTPIQLQQYATYTWEMQIDANNHVAVRLWPVGGARPAVPTLAFDNGGQAYEPIAAGDLWQIELQDTGGHCEGSTGRSHTHRTQWDDVCVSPLD